MPKKQLFGYTKVRRYKDGRFVEELRDIIIGCITHEARKELIDEIKRNNFTVIKYNKEYDLLEVPLYE